MKAVAEIADWSRPATRKTGHSFNVQELLQNLPASEQVVLNLRIVHDLPFRDIAAVVGISIEAAKKRAQRGLRTLRERMRNSKPQQRQRDAKSCLSTLDNEFSGFLKTSVPKQTAQT